MKSKEFAIVMVSLNYRVLYAYEILPILHGSVFTPITVKVFVKIAAALTSNMGSLLIGAAAAGKSETVRALSFVLAKPLFAWEFDAG